MTQVNLAEDYMPLYNKLVFSVLLDDRAERVRVKFADFWL